MTDQPIRSGGDRRRSGRWSGGDPAAAPGSAAPTAEGTHQPGIVPPPQLRTSTAHTRSLRAGGTPRLDPATPEVVAVVAVGDSPYGVAVGR